VTYTFYPGCALEASAVPYGRSTEAVSKALGLELVHLDDWNCCGATCYTSMAEITSFAVSARNLALAEPAERDVVTCCNGCYMTLSKTNNYMRDDRRIGERVNAGLAAAGLKYEGTVEVRHFLDVVLNDLPEGAIASKVKVDLAGLRVAPYHGCQLVRPYATFLEDEFPKGLDAVIEMCGAVPVDYPLTAKCCGGMLMQTSKDVSVKLCTSLMKLAMDRGADCILTACPLCHMNLEGYQDAIGERMGREIQMPIVYFPQLMGMAMGLPAQDVSLEASLVPVDDMLAKVKPLSEATEPVAAG
jgi:heterodisulfide reductase subunit B